jgi:5,10-methylenetetrahydrofolate reductase
LRLTDKLQQRKPVLVVELKPDDPNLGRYVELVRPYIDAVRLTALKNAADLEHPERTAEQISFDSATSIARNTGLDVIGSLVCRDHPRDDGHILKGLDRAGVHNLLALYGDPNDAPYPNRYEFKTSGELIRWVRKQEAEHCSSPFCIAVGSDPTSTDTMKQVTTLNEKRDAGADLTITQPIFQAEQAIESLKAIQAASASLPTLVGLLVPRTEKTINFLEKRLGVKIPDATKRRVKTGGVAEGLEVIREVYRTLWDQAAGFYIYPWADPELDIVTVLLQELRQRGA